MSYDRNYLLYFSGSLALGLALIFSAAFYAEPLKGDLTRVGGWTERDFGWREPLPVIDVDPNFEDMGSAGILVLGDSFSMANMWQSLLGRAQGRTVASHNYEQFACIEQWLEMLEAHGNLAGKTVIVEVLERFLAIRFGDTGACRKSKSRGKGPIKPFEALMHGEMPTSLRTGGNPPTDVVYLLKILKNEMLTAIRGPQAVMPGVAVNAPLSSSRFFSNRRSDRILYYFEDDAEANWMPEQIEKVSESILRIQRRIEAAGGRFLLLLVPNKSTVYSDFIVGRPNVDHYSPIVRQFQKAGVAVIDLLKPFRERIENEVDFYLPDDTHVGTRGYQIMGETVSARMGPKTVN
ncbi:MAG: hypothetical protein PHT19_02350 [Methylococcus sp.]|nr:hypothetical protein [Methylococcus sp.]